MLVDLGLQEGLWYGPDDRVHMFPVLEEEDAGNGADSKPTGGSLVLVHIQLPNRKALLGKLLGQLRHDGGHHTAWTAPCGPEIDNGETSGPLNCLPEVTVRNFEYLFTISHRYHSLSERAALDTMPPGSGAAGIR